MWERALFLSQFALMAICWGVGVAGADADKAPPALVEAKADRVYVDKSERRLRLYSGETMLREYPVALGIDPIGDKTSEGDGRTPEGSYHLDWRNDKSAFFLSIHVSYPNQADREAAGRRGLDPGGDIFIHGSPNWWPFDGMFPFGDWTAGCIALSNDDMREIWRLVDNGAPIDIAP